MICDTKFLSLSVWNDCKVIFEIWREEGIKSEANEDSSCHANSAKKWIREK